MTRLQKKCFLASVGMHGLLLLILVGSSAFRSKPAAHDMPILTLIPANILDQAGAGGGSPEPATAAPQPAQPAPTVVQSPLHGAQLLVHPTPRPVEKPPEPKPEPQQEPRPPEPQPAASRDAAIKPAHKPHEIVPTFEPVKSATSKKNPKPAEAAETESSSSAEARRLRRQIAQSLDALASGVKNSGANGTVVDEPGQGGGEAFAGYETFIYNAYYHAWITPDSVANKLAAADVKIVVARDGTILSAEIINKSGESSLDKSVEKALRKVTKLPPFPASARDEQRIFKIRFNPEAKEGSG